jgi:hypothetical protein
MIQPGVSEEEAGKSFAGHKVIELPSGKHYLRETPQP